MTPFNYLDGIAEKRLLLQRCARCKSVKMMSAMGVGPLEQPMCPSCHSLEWETFEATGRGTVGSYIVNVRSPAEPKPIFAMVLLDEGPCFYSTIVGVAADKVRNEMPVEAVFSEEDGCVVLQFAPAQ
jgi:uncharacterized OB-fold protein